MRIYQDVKLDFSDVLLVPQRSDLKSRAEVTLERTYQFRHSKHTWNGIGIIAANFDTVGSFNMAKALARHKVMTALHKHYSVEELVRFFADNEKMSDYVFYTIGTNENDLLKLDSVAVNVVNRWKEYPASIEDSRQIFPKFICIDVANGYTEDFVNHVKKVRGLYPNSVIMAGNVVTPNMTEELILSGADIVKVGIGPGSVCTTRIKTGVGYPQLSAIDECSFAAHGKPQGQLCGDGGCTNAGDVAKAFAAGADFVMVGGLLAGTDECDGEWTYKNEIIEDKENGWKVASHRVKDGLKFYGMSSRDAQEKHHGKMGCYKASEGKSVIVPYKGTADDVILDILGGLRSACSYVGAKSLKDLPKCASFVRVNNQYNKVFGQ